MPCSIDAENVSMQVAAVGDVEVPAESAEVIVKFINQDYGWDKLVQKFTSGEKECKERDACRVEVDAQTLAYIGAVRKQIVVNAFDCFKVPYQALQAAGSTTLTSDFDVCVLGRDACFTMWLMFKHFKCTYKTTLPTALDNNLYANGTYGPDNLKPVLPGFRAVPLKSRDVMGQAIDVVALFPDAAAAAKLQSWATVKVLHGLLLNGNRELDLLPFMDGDTRIAAQSKLDQASRIDDLAVEIMELLPGCGGEEGAGIETSYALQFYFARRLNFLMYGDAHPSFSAAPFTKTTNADPAKVQEYMDKAAAFDAELEPHVRVFKHDFVDILCLCMFFSVEAAYTQSAVNVVVLEMQARAIPRGGCVPGDYRTTLVEVLGDFLVHFPRGDAAATPAKVLKFSKYVHRLVYAAGELHDRDDWRAWADDVKARVVSKRGNMEVEVAPEDWELVRFNESMTCDDYRRAIIGVFNELYGAYRSSTTAPGEVEGSLGTSIVASAVKQGGGTYPPFMAWAALTAVTLAAALSIS